MTFHFEATKLEEVENFRGATCIVSSIIAQQYRSIHQTSLCLAYEQNKAARTIHFRQLHTRVVVRACVRGYLRPRLLLELCTDYWRLSPYWHSKNKTRRREKLIFSSFTQACRCTYVCECTEIVAGAITLCDIFAI